MGARILVTGAGGFVGAAACKAALAAGHDVVAVIRNGTSRLAGIADAISIARVDLADTPAVAALLGSTRPDIVVHSAWEGVGGALRSGDIQLDNIRTTVALADAAIGAGARKFVGIGSQAEYGRYDRKIVEADLPAADHALRRREARRVPPYGAALPRRRRGFCLAAAFLGLWRWRQFELADPLDRRFAGARKGAAMHGRHAEVGLSAY